MILALLAAAGALLAWPDRRSGRPLGSAAGPSPRAVVERALRSPLWVAVPAAGVAAVLSTPLVAALAGVGAALAVRSVSARRAAARDDARLAGLADGLGALAADLRSGRSLESATASAAAACGEVVTGGLLTGALRAPDASRGDDAPGELGTALGRIAAGVRLSARTGCSLAAVVGAVEDDLRARARQRAELRAATAGPRASALVLAGLPVLGLAMGSGVGADPWRVLTTTPTGQLLLVGGAALEAAGVVWSRRLVDRAVR
ncbi:type II secretion system F family protein [Blastococcus sp. TF02A-30]|uniref:type II secretion system F family protein n=1 Tax=Blastococcus sp. TF02A-30 TaxID=2250580 RepID=UPI000DE8000F|nr:pilus assembly protein TadB [Blastococcus sp. TF02A-30]RBY83479.1 pilus assembly protein TadB [Blastococcus sp. TF02A-30]